MSKFVLHLEIPAFSGGDPEPGTRNPQSMTRNLRVEVNSPSHGKWRSFESALPGCHGGQYMDGDQQRHPVHGTVVPLGAQSGGSAYFDDGDNLIFKLLSFKPNQNLDNHKAGHRGEGFFVSSPIAQATRDFEYEIIARDGQTE